MDLTTTRTRTTTLTGTTVRRRARGLKAAFAALCLGAATLTPALPVTGAAGDHTALPAVANPARLDALNATETMTLRRNGFVVTAPSSLRSDNGAVQPHYMPPSQSRADNHEVYWQFNDLYQDNYFDGVPTFMTSDALLHTWHVVYDQTLIVLERHALAPRLARLSDGLVATSAMQYNAATAPSLAEAVRLNLGYLAVAGRLLGAPASDPRADRAAGQPGACPHRRSPGFRHVAAAGLPRRLLGVCPARPLRRRPRVEPLFPGHDLVQPARLPPQRRRRRPAHAPGHPVGARAGGECDP